MEFCRKTDGVFVIKIVAREPEPNCYYFLERERDRQTRFEECQEVSRERERGRETVMVHASLV